MIDDPSPAATSLTNQLPCNRAVVVVSASSSRKLIDSATVVSDEPSGVISNSGSLGARGGIGVPFRHGTGVGGRLNI